MGGGKDRIWVSLLPKFGNHKRRKPINVHCTGSDSGAKHSDLNREVAAFSEFAKKDLPQHFPDWTASHVTSAAFSLASFFVYAFPMKTFSFILHSMVYSVFLMV